MIFFNTELTAFSQNITNIFLRLKQSRKLIIKKEKTQTLKKSMDKKVILNCAKQIIFS